MQHVGMGTRGRSAWASCTVGLALSFLGEKNGREKTWREAKYKCSGHRAGIDPGFGVSFAIGFDFEGHPHVLVLGPAVFAAGVCERGTG